MKFIQIGDIKLQYDESVVDIERIVKIIKLNQYLFADYRGKVISLCTSISSINDNIVYVTDFDKFFDNLLKMLINDNGVIVALNQPDLLSILYTQLLMKKAIKNGESVVMIDEGIPDDMLWFMIACKYFNYKTEFNELSNFLKYRNDSELIFDWLKETQRFKTYNYLLEIFSSYLKEYDLSFFDNIEKIVSKINEENVTLSLSLPKEENYILPKLSFENFEKILFDFLDNIKAPEQWKNLYTKLKNENRILFEESKDGFEHSEVFEDKNGIKKIRVTTDGTIKYFVSFVHEFMHYVSLQENMPPISLNEFPSIYYEKQAGNYLINIGYDENTIKQVIRDRNQNNFDIYSCLFEILLDICIYNKKGQLTIDDKIAPFKKSIEMNYEIRKKLAKICEESGDPINEQDFFNIFNYDFKSAANKDCDEVISRYVKKGILVLNGYQYLTGSYLVDSILEKQDGDTTLDKMIFVTEHLANFDIEKIINYLEIDNAFSKKSRN